MPSLSAKSREKTSTAMLILTLYQVPSTDLILLKSHLINRPKKCDKMKKKNCQTSSRWCVTLHHACPRVCVRIAGMELHPRTVRVNSCRHVWTSKRIGRRALLLIIRLPSHHHHHLLLLLIILLLLLLEHEHMLLLLRHGGHLHV